MDSTVDFSSVDGFVSLFVSAALGLCSQIQTGLPAGTGLDPLQVIVAGNLFRLIEQKGELNRVGYFKHGIGATLWDARKPRLIAGIVDIDLGRDPDGLTCYKIDPLRINYFATSTGLAERTNEEIEEACEKLVHAGVLSACTDPFTPPPRSVIPGRWCIPRLRQDSQCAWVADLGFELYWGPIGPVPNDYREHLMEARRYLELSLLLYPKPVQRQQTFEWSEVTILEDKDILPQDN